MSCPQEVKSLHFQYKTAYEVALELGVSSEDAVKGILVYKEKKEKKVEKPKVDKGTEDKPKVEKPKVEKVEEEKPKVEKPKKVKEEKPTELKEEKPVEKVKGKKVKKTEPAELQPES